MSRTKTNVSRGLLERIIKDVESDTSPPNNHNELWERVVLKYNQLAVTPVTKSVLYLRSREWGIVINTPKARRKHTSRQPKIKVSRGEKLKIHGASFDAQKKVVPSRFINLVVLAEQGSLKAMISLKCLECTTYQIREIKECTLVQCPLYPVRPYQGELGGVLRPLAGV